MSVPYAIPTPTVKGRSCTGYAIFVRNFDLQKPLRVLKIDHTKREIVIGCDAK